MNNDPVNKIDPTGLYECGNEQSQVQCEEIEEGVGEIKKARNNLKRRIRRSGKNLRLATELRRSANDLDSVIDFLAKDNVTIGFGQAREGTGDISISTNFFGSVSYNITIDNSVRAGNSQHSVSHVLAHEAGHGHFHNAGIKVPPFREEGLAQRYGNAVDWGLSRNGQHRNSR